MGDLMAAHFLLPQKIFDKRTLISQYYVRFVKRPINETITNSMIFL